MLYRAPHLVPYNFLYLINLLSIFWEVEQLISYCPCPPQTQHTDHSLRKKYPWMPEREAGINNKNYELVAITPGWVLSATVVSIAEYSPELLLLSAPAMDNYIPIYVAIIIDSHTFEIGWVCCCWRYWLIGGLRYLDWWHVWGVLCRRTCLDIISNITFIWGPGQGENQALA